MARLPSRPFVVQSPGGVMLAGVALAMFGLIGCGAEEQESEEPAQVTGKQRGTGKREPQPRPQSQRNSRAPRAEDFDVPLNGPLRIVPGHAPVLDEWATNFSKRIHAEGDDSASEKVAVRFESACALLFDALLKGDEEQTRRFVTDAFAGFEDLLGELTPRSNDGVFEVHDQLPGSGQRSSSADVIADWNAAGWSADDVRASVVAIEADANENWHVRVELRIVGKLGDTPAMLDLELSAMIPKAESANPLPRVAQLRVTSLRRIQRNAPAFTEISTAVFGGVAHWDRELGLGCEDYNRKTDQRQIPFGTGILGMALGDVNGDGLEDIYLSAIGGFPNRLFLHQPDGTVRDGAAQAGVDVLDTTRGALLVDLDGDGDLDLALARTAEVVLFWNDGSGKFSRPEVLDGPGNAPIYSISAADPDVDGDLDLFATRYPTSGGDEGVPTPYHDAQNGASNLYWRNEGEHRFTLAGEETGLNSGHPRYSFVSLWDDFNGDGQIDLYVINDFGPNNLYINEDGHFTDQAAAGGMIDSAAGMGISVADVEMDGDLDVYVTNMYSAPGLRATAEAGYRPGDDLVRGLHRRMAQGNSLLLQGMPGEYRENGIAAGVDHGGWAWGAVFHDWNLDGLPDLYVPNGFVSAQRREDVESLFWRWIVRVTPPPSESMADYYRNWGAMSLFNQVAGYSYNGYERNHVYLNIGQAQFADVSPLSAADFIDDGRVASRVDWDGDGYEDLLLINRTAPRLRLIRNVQSENGNHRVVVELLSNSGPAGAIGARVSVLRSDGKTVTRTLYAGEGLLGQSSTRMFFGLGKAEGPVQVSVRWPNGEQTVVKDLAADRGWRVQQSGSAEEWAFSKSPFAGQPASPAKANARGVERCVLAARMPLRSLALQHSSGARRKLGELGPSPKLLTLWDPSSRSGEAFLRQLAASKQWIEKTGTLLVPVALEGAEDGEGLLQELGIARHALSASASDLMVIEALLVETLNTYDEIELPLSLLLDKNSNLCALYFGEIRSEDLLEDLSILQNKRKGLVSTLALSGGYWLGQPQRRYGQLVRVLMMLGARELATDLKKQ